MFRDREDAALMLARRLQDHRGDPALIALGIPRGGLVVAAIVARELDVPLDAVFSKKIGHPLSPEYAIGVVTLDSVRVDDKAVASDAVSRAYIDEEAGKIRGLLLDRRERYLGGQAPLELQGKTALVIDDGAATGLTELAAVDAARGAGAARVVVALPVASQEAAQELAAAADELVCLATPWPFYSIGEFYDDFEQVDDATAVRVLREARAQRSAGSSGSTSRSLPPSFSPERWPPAP